MWISSYSKYGSAQWNPQFSASVTGEQVLIYDVDNFKKCGWYQTGAYNKPTVAWDNDFTTLFLATTATADATGYLDIEDIPIVIGRTVR